MLIPKIKVKISKYIFLIKLFRKIQKKHCQDPTRDLLDSKVEFVCWCLHFELKTLKFLRKQMCSEQNCIIGIFIYICDISHITWNPLKFPKSMWKKHQKSFLVPNIGLSVVQQPRLLRSYLLWVRNLALKEISYHYKVTTFSLYLFFAPFHLTWEHRSSTRL